MGTWLGILFFGALPLAAAGLVLRWTLLEFRRDRIPILLYHRLISRKDAEQGRLADDEMIYASYDTSFAEQMAYLQTAGYTTIDLDDYLLMRSGMALFPKRPVLITFDDGYLSNYTMAYPVLKANAQKAVIFVAPQPDEYTRRLVAGIDGFLSGEQMREMAASGISIQSHTLTHCILGELDDTSALCELTESRHLLREITGREINHIAIPRSGYTRRIRRLVREAGYLTACCNNKGSANLSSDLLVLPRIVIERDMTLADFARCLGPRGAAILRVMGNLKRLPALLFGGRAATRLRRLLYGSPLRPLFQTRNLKKALAVFVVLYVSGTLLFFWHIIVAA